MADDREEWRCFHCGEVFTDRQAALCHFGDSEMEQTACKLNQLEGGILELYREAQRELHRFRIEDNASFREFYALGSDHYQRERRAEEKGYERGLNEGGFTDGYKAGVAACDPIDTATGLTWKERFLERAERCAQAEVERDTIKARYATPAGQQHRTPQEWQELLDGRDKFIVEKGLFAEFVKSLPGPTPPDKSHAAMYPPDGGLPKQVRDIEDVPSLHEVVTAHFKAKADKRKVEERRGPIAEDRGLRVNEPFDKSRTGKDRRKAQPETSAPTVASRMTLTQPCGVCGKPVLVNAVSPSECFCSSECATAHLDEPETGEVK